MSTTAPPPLPQLTITYFEFGGRVEPSRLTCVIGGIPFTNEVVPIAEFAERKKDLPMHQLPLLYVDQEETDRAIVGQSDAILRYVGKLAGLYPTDPVEAMKVDHWMDVMGDWTKYVMLTYGGAKSNFISETEWTEEELMAVGKRAIENAFPKFLGAIELEIERNGGTYIMGDEPTIADMKLMHWIPWIQSGGLPAFPPSCLDAYPRVLALVDSIEAFPEVQAYRAKHPIPYGDFDYIPESTKYDAADDDDDIPRGLESKQKQAKSTRELV